MILRKLCAHMGELDIIQSYETDDRHSGQTIQDPHSSRRYLGLELGGIVLPAGAGIGFNNVIHHKYLLDYLRCHINR